MCRLLTTSWFAAALLIWSPAFAQQRTELAQQDADSSNVPIAHLVEQRLWDLAAQRITAGADVSAVQGDGMTALHWAVFHGHHRTVEKLIAAGADPDAENEYNVAALTIACRNGDARIAAALLEAGANPNATLASGETVLMTAARTGNAEVVAALIDEGANVNAKERRGQTALMWAAADGNVNAVDRLLRGGAEVDYRLKSGFCALMFASRQGHIHVVNRLLDEGVDVSRAMRPEKTGGRHPRNGTSALLLAVESGHFELAMRLVAAGADPNDQRSGFTPLHAITWVRKTNRGDGVDGDPPPRGSGRLHSLQFVRDIVAAGADVNRQLQKGSGGRAKLNMKGATPFLLAAKTADLPLLKLLLELGADPTIPNADGCTPLMAAAGIGVVAVGEEAGTEPEVLATIQWLVDLGADPNVVDENGETAMHGAAYRNYPLAVALLHQLGARGEVWNRKNKHGWTPQLIAAGNRPGSFKPSPETIAALEAALRDND